MENALKAKIKFSIKTKFVQVISTLILHAFIQCLRFSVYCHVLIVCNVEQRIVIHS